MLYLSNLASILWYYLINNNDKYCKSIMQSSLPFSLKIDSMRRVYNEYAYIDKNKTIESQPNPDLVFLARRLTPDIIKDIVAIRAKNNNIRILVLCKENNLTKEISNDLIDEIIEWKYYYDLIKLIEKINPKTLVLIRRGNSAGIILGTILFKGKLIYRPWPFAYIMQSKIGYVKKIDLIGEKYIIENCDGVYHFFHNEINKELGKYIKITCPFIQIFPGCVKQIEEYSSTLVHKKLSENDKELHIVYAAGLYRKAGFTKRTSYLYSFKYKFEQIIKNKIHLHVYTPYLTEADLHKDFIDLNKSKYFHLEKTLEYHDLIVEMRKYDFAMYHFDYSNFPTRNKFDWFASNAFFTYIQSGLPIIVSNTTPGLSELVIQNNIGLSNNDNDFSDIKYQLEKLDYVKLEKNVKEAQKTFKHNANDLIKLFLNK
jgi:hypothetical protein